MIINPVSLLFLGVGFRGILHFSTVTLGVSGQGQDFGATARARGRIFIIFSAELVFLHTRIALLTVIHI
jgi:hypothetical protein